MASRDDADYPRGRAVLAKVVTGYCVIALLVCIVLGIMWGRQRSKLATVAREKSTALDVISRQADQTDATARALSDEQAANRSSYTGPEAVAMSMKVQAAQTEAKVFNDQQMQAQAAVDASRERVRVLSLRFVPLVAIGAAHFLLLILIALANPRRPA
jgi:hypothetical protein